MSTGIFWRKNPGKDPETAPGERRINGYLLAGIGSNQRNDEAKGRREAMKQGSQSTVRNKSKRLLSYLP
jgi:hypothetical protein